MNIWYIHPYATPYEISGLHRPFEFGQYMVERGHKLTVFSAAYLHFSGDNMIHGKEKYIIKNYDGIETVFIRTCEYKDSKVKRIYNMFEFWFRCISVAKQYEKIKEKPDVIIASSPHPMAILAGLRLSKKYHVPCISEIRDLWPEDFFEGGMIKEHSIIGRMCLRGERYLYEKSNKIVFLQEGDYTYILDHKWDTDHGGKIDINKCKYINNGVDVSLFNSRCKEFPVENKDSDGQYFDVVYCGTIRPINNLDLIVDTAKLVNKNIRFIVYGTGNCEEKLKQRVKNEKISNVFFKGYLENKLVPSALRNASATILNYSDKLHNWSHGSSSNKLFEYLAAGKPVISTVKMGYDILAKYDCGISAETCDAEGIAQAVNKIYETSKEKYQNMCENAKKASLAFDIPVLTDKYFDVIDEAIDDLKNKGERKK